MPADLETKSVSLPTLPSLPPVSRKSSKSLGRAPSVNSGLIQTVDAGYRVMMYLQKGFRQYYNGGPIRVEPPVCGIYCKDFSHELHKAVAESNVSEIALLCSRGADPNQHCGPNRIPELFWATIQGNPLAVRALLESGADVNLDKGLMKASTLETAVAYGRPEILKICLDAGANPNHKMTYPWWTNFLLWRFKGGTTLHAASYLGNAQMVALLLEAGSDPQMRTNNGNTPVDCCECEDCLALLLQAGGNLRPVLTEDRLLAGTWPPLEKGLSPHRPDQSSPSGTTAKKKGRIDRENV